jgi:hypothetical protein
MQVHAPILAAPESIRATKFPTARAQRPGLRENPSVQTLAERRFSERLSLQRGGFTSPKRQNNNFLDCALLSMLC